MIRPTGDLISAQIRRVLDGVRFLLRSSSLQTFAEPAAEPAARPKGKKKRAREQVWDPADALLRAGKRIRRPARARGRFFGLISPLGDLARVVLIELSEGRLSSTFCDKKTDTCA